MFAERYQAELAARLEESSRPIDDATATAFAAELKKQGEDDEEPVPAAKLKKGASRRKKVSRDPEPLVALAGLLTREDAEGLATELRLTVTDPHAYVDRFRSRLALRGVRDTEPAGTTLPWAVLVDGLAERGQLAELDWREAPEDVREQLGKLRTGLFREKKLEIDEDLSTEDLLRTLAKQLAREGVGTTILDLHSDSLRVAFYALDDEASVNKLAKQCEKAGFGKARAP